MYAWSGIPSRDNLDLHIKWSQRVSVVTEQSLDLFRRHLISYKLKRAGFYFAFCEVGRPPQNSFEEMNSNRKQRETKREREEWLRNPFLAY